MNEEEKIRILMVDDHQIFRSGLRLLIEANPTFAVAGECGCLGDAAQMIDDLRPDLTLLDLKFEDGNGLDLIPKMAEKTKLIVLTGETDPLVHEKCLKSGANGLVSKEMASKELFDAMTCVFNGEMWFDKGLMGKVVRELTRPEGNGTVDLEVRRIQTLSPREREVIMLVGEGLKNMAIAERLFISETTVRHHMTSILSKLEVSSRLELVVFA
jgi:two-component system response regulator DegU